MENWISVKEMLPNIERRVLASSQLTGKIMIGAIEHCLCGECTGYTCFDAEKTLYLEDVTHWMPLPEPPERKGGRA